MNFKRTALYEQIARLETENKELRAALDPFAEIGRRLGWDKIAEDDDTQLNQHVMEAPAPDLGDKVFYCLFISAFRRAALIINGGDDDRPVGTGQSTQGAAAERG